MQVGVARTDTLLRTIGMLISKFTQSQNDLHPYIPILGGVITGCGLIMLLK
jgi:hypothetical protein